MSDAVVKRRRIRKGTHSCWECRRRKVKCRFDDPRDSTCINCFERESACVSQKFSLDANSTSSSDAPGHGGRADSSASRVPSAEPFCPTVSTEDLVDCSAAAHAQGIAAAANGTVIEDGVVSPHQAPTSTSPNTASPETWVNHPYVVAHQRNWQDRHRQISRQLHALLPSSQLRSVLAHHSPAASLVLTFAHTRDDQIAGRVEPNWSLASTNWPPPDAHAVLIARRLLQYAICVQSLPPNPGRARLMSITYQQSCELVGTWVAAVSTLVASDDDLICFAEGIETLALLSMFQADSGHLRRAWTTTRRALNLCQVMGIGTPSTRRPIRSCTGAKDRTIIPSIPVLWHRLNCSDRYHSLILGLPVGIHKDNFACVDLLPSGDSVEQLGAEHAFICKKIADRNDLPLASADAFSITQSISSDLERASNNMDGVWWAIPDFPAGAALDATSSQLLAARSTINLQVQHFTLHILLHLPYLLQDKEGHVYHESQQACRRASRAVLERLLSYRKHNLLNCAGRRIDYSALIAAMTLPLTYLERCGGEGEDMARDRKLLQSAIMVFREMASYLCDRLAIESADTIHQLLPIVAVDPVGMDEGPLKLKIPFLGTVIISHQLFDKCSLAEDGESALTKEPALDDSGLDPQLFLSLDSDPFEPQASTSFLSAGTFELSPTAPPFLNPGAEDWTLQGIDTAYWSTLGQAMGGGESMDQVDGSTIIREGMPDSSCSSAL